ncbi:hypothetical protein RYX36_034408 [Vicia faba]
MIRVLHQGDGVKEGQIWVVFKGAREFMAEAGSVEAIRSRFGVWRFVENGGRLCKGSDPKGAAVEWVG